MFGQFQYGPGVSIPTNDVAYARGQAPGMPQDANGMQPGLFGGMPPWMQRPGFASPWNQPPATNSMGQQQPPMTGLLGSMTPQPLLGGPPGLSRESDFERMKRLMGIQPVESYGVPR